MANANHCVRITGNTEVSRSSNMLSRREFLRSATKYCAGLYLGCSKHVVAYASGPTDTPRLKETASVSVPGNFIGLGYEMSSVAAPALLNVDNHRYVNLIKRLGSAGVIRVGGIVADYTRYEPNGISRAEHTTLTIKDTCSHYLFRSN